MYRKAHCINYLKMLALITIYTVFVFCFFFASYTLYFMPFNCLHSSIPGGNYAEHKSLREWKGFYYVYTFKWRERKAFF